ncbi:hypothetical protein DY000_02005089 [Brassica cretica]|uniref:Uncharacterized protein n=1 Tax=Brassica cretica TaxID=69181 RepID=A0ABQ7C6M5_BRACR|nr:hypothetical protein DY000_02005089 [Brassica cretica]
MDRSRCQFVDPMLETVSGLSGYQDYSKHPDYCDCVIIICCYGVYLVLVLLCENLVVVLVVVYRSLLPQMPPTSPIEDRGTAISIEDHDQAISECLRLCGVLVKGLPVSLMWRKNDYVRNSGSLSETSSLTPHILLKVTSRKDHSARGTVGDHSSRGTVGAGVD